VHCYLALFDSLSADTEPFKQLFLPAKQGLLVQVPQPTPRFPPASQNLGGGRPMRSFGEWAKSYATLPEVLDETGVRKLFCFPVGFRVRAHGARNDHRGRARGAA
jgi:hypothetical protein